MNDLKTILGGDVVEVAKRLLGSELIRLVGDQKIVVKIVETEAYDQNDVASHSFKGQTARNEVMFGEAGHAYIYFTYGMHHCFNIVTSKSGYGAAVLIRAVEPVKGLEMIKDNRPKIQRTYDLTNGPAKLCQALLLDKKLNGHDLNKPPLQLRLKEPINLKFIKQTSRIGISQGLDKLWRFYIKDNPYVSNTIFRVSVMLAK